MPSRSPLGCDFDFPRGADPVEVVEQPKFWTFDSPQRHEEHEDKARDYISVPSVISVVNTRKIYSENRPYANTSNNAGRSPLSTHCAISLPTAGEIAQP